MTHVKNVQKLLLHSFLLKDHPNHVIGQFHALPSAIKDRHWVSSNGAADWHPRTYIDCLVVYAGMQGMSLPNQVQADY